MLIKKVEKTSIKLQSAAHEEENDTFSWEIKFILDENFFVRSQVDLLLCLFNNFNSKTAFNLKRGNKDMDDELFIAFCFKSEWQRELCHTISNVILHL